MISHSGAKKLLAQRPLQKILPVDEYLPIMFDEHPKYENTYQTCVYCNLEGFHGKVLGPVNVDSYIIHTFG